MRKFSLVIITKNEAENIRRCLESVRGLTDDIVVFDSGSTDRTREICEAFGARVFQHDFIDFSDQKNRANAKARYDWILSLDADEAFSDDLRREFLETLTLNDEGCFEFNRLTNYCGHWVRHCGWYPDWKLRFFNRERMKWEGSIHEDLTGADKENIHRLKGNLLHFSYYSLDDHRKQAEKFTRMKALRMKGDRKKDNFFLSLASGVWKFIHIYILRQGFLDGRSGWNIARISAYYASIRYQLRK